MKRSKFTERADYYCMQGEYQSLTIRLANDPAKLKGVKGRLKARRLATPLSKAKAFTQNLETAYEISMRDIKIGCLLRASINKRIQFESDKYYFLCIELYMTCFREIEKGHNRSKS